jgi:hypothetical protein
MIGANTGSVGLERGAILIFDEELAVVNATTKEKEFECTSTAA